jgi:hypothetical protein
MKAASGRKSSSAEGKKLGIKIQSFGPTPEEVQALARSVTRHRAVQSYLAKTRSRLLRIDLLEPAQETKLVKPKPPDRFRAVFYDYTNNRTVLAIGRVAKLMALEVTESSLQPRPSDEEFEDAVSIVREHPEFGVALREQRLLPYQPMPPLVGEELPDGRVERTIAVGLLPQWQACVLSRARANPQCEVRRGCLRTLPRLAEPGGDDPGQRRRCCTRFSSLPYPRQNHTRHRQRHRQFPWRWDLRARPGGGPG